MFWPVLVWLTISSVLLLWRYHHTQSARAAIQFTVSMEGRDGQISHEATVDGLSYQSGGRCGVGWKRLVVRAENAEPFETNCFVWYAGASFGNLTLLRSRGRLDLELSPAVESVHILGAQEGMRLTNVTLRSLSLPTGRYTVEAKFAHFSSEQTIDVIRNQNTPVIIAPELTALNLSSEPDKAEFELKSTKRPDISLKGTTPMTITSLPVGEYAIRIAQGDYRKNLPVRLGGPNATNELKVEFRYGKLSFISEPPEANVTARGKVIGQTPTTLKLPPDSYQFQIQKDGFFGTNVSLTLLETDSRTVSVSLANVAFVEAIERAHQHAALHEYERAFSDVEKALRIQPDHEAALRLQRTIQFHLHLQNGRQFFRTGEHTKALMEADAALKLKDGDAETLALRAEVEKSQLEAKAARAKARQEKEAVEMETRRKRPENVLNDVSRQFPHHQFFDNEQIRFIGSVDKVSTGVLMALRRDPQWNILRDEKVDGDIAVTVAELRGLLKKQRAVIVTGQIADDEVVVYFKLFQLAGPSGASEEGYQPFLARDETGVRAELITKRLNREVLEFRNRINDGVLNHGKSN